MRARPLRASDRCLQEKRKTITGDDILFAMATLGFDNHIDPLRIYLQKYREVSYNTARLQNSTSTLSFPYTAHKDRQGR